MPDYGHDLIFGSFVTPTSAPPRHAVELAQASEAAGLDLVTFQDHPYQARFLDTWTLLSAVAASTERVRVAPNVLNLPLRPPAVLARAAASLDLLSGGRLELGLGAGAFWDAIEAMGGRRLTAGQAAEALGEAIDILRGTWDADNPALFRVDGAYYQVHGAKRGPAPAHDIGIWLGAYKPKMLRLTGAKADGWLPSLPYFQGGLAEARDSNEIIDEAAATAGRSPAAIRRLLNIGGRFGRAGTGEGFLTGPPAAWVEQLAPLTLELGFSAFILMADDPATVQIFGQEVAPALRALVAKERAPATPSSSSATGFEDERDAPPRLAEDVVPVAEDVLPVAGDVVPAPREAAGARRAAPGTQMNDVRGGAVRSRRRPGIDYDAVPASLTGPASVGATGSAGGANSDTTGKGVAGTGVAGSDVAGSDVAVIEPGDPGYAAVRSTYLRGGSPGLVLRPGTVDEVADALAFARAQPVTRRVPLSIRSGGHGVSGRSTNDGGIVLDLGRLDAIEVLDEATRRVRVGPGARWADVAAALAPYGWALSSGDYGGVGVGGLATAGGVGWLAREHGLTIDHLRAADLVLADGTRVRASDTENPDLFWAVRGAGANFGIVTSFEFEADEVGDVGFAQLVLDASDTAGFLRRWGAALEAAPRDLTSFVILSPPRRGLPALARVMAVVDSADPQTVVSRLQPLADAGPLLDHAIQIVPYSAIMEAPRAEHGGVGEPVSRSALADHLTPELADAAARLLENGQAYFFQVRSVGGAVADVPADATAYAGRSANFSLVAFGASRAGLDRAWDAMRPHFSGLYLNFETDQRPERVADAFPPATLRRLRALKRRYDPDNVFRDNFNVTADGRDATAAPPIPV
ncbi:LLM class flavin-dependent oxidoreductase [Frankia nepalensis]|uniref:LLM class flavin-dependent oxidoreductase n=3 Tax=Frankia nepalensis TaxID=1836974 RepID=A0A937R761_9ACTN|nr:LLM class flavin-dependent oxidoreductase [Frankia nepalensis]MBL7511202.1 LLM class flavin-dependent oxidoreductase [Frankia nepalensis]MBL7626958.1 LLM class flavin-dependent oxidoreductase [Frankia nepalensis]